MGGDSGVYRADDGTAARGRGWGGEDVKIGREEEGFGRL